MTTTPSKVAGLPGWRDRREAREDKAKHVSGNTVGTRHRVFIYQKMLTLGKYLDAASGGTKEEGQYSSQRMADY